MSDDVDAAKRAQGRSFIKKLIIGKVILLIIMLGIGFYLYSTI